MSSPLAPLRNRAGDSKSPYIARHASSPVAWQLLDQQALDRAVRENKLIFLNIGNASCSYAQLMTQDSWSRPAVAAVLNQSFIPILVDKDERPDIDPIYAHYLGSIHGKAGYPMNLFLMPNLRPVYGDTFVDGLAEDSDGKPDEDTPSILFILKRVAGHWQDENAKLIHDGNDAYKKLQDILAEGTRSRPADADVDAPVHVDIDLETMEDAYKGHAKLYDPEYAGFLSVPADLNALQIIPKFPMVSRLDFLMRLARLPPPVIGIVGDDECERATKMALNTLRKMRDMAMHDHLAGGFHASTQTRDWAFPLFDKSTGHNGLLLDLYLDAWLTTTKPEDRTSTDYNKVWREPKHEFLDVVLSLADYLTTSPICLPSGGFATSEAASSPSRREGANLRAGAYYTWSKRDFMSALEGVPGSPGLAASFWNVEDGGNIDPALDPRDEFISQNVLYVNSKHTDLATRYGVDPGHVRNDLLNARNALRKHRETNRNRPEVDARVIAVQNGKVIAALSRTGAALRTINPAVGKKYLDVAEKAAAFIKEKLWDSETHILYRIYGSGGRQDLPGFAEDYAFLIEGLLNLYEAAGDDSWLQWADELQTTQLSHFYDYRSPESPATAQHAHCGGFYTSHANSEHAIFRVKNAMDEVSPSINGVSSSNLFRLGALLGDTKYTELAKETIAAFEVEVPAHPSLFTSLLVNLVTAKLGGAKWLVFDPMDIDDVDKDATRANSTSDPSAIGNDTESTKITNTVTGKALQDKFHSMPRAGMRTLTTLRSDSWLVKRNSALQAVLAENKKYAYVFDKGKEAYRLVTPEELESLAIDT